MYIETQSILVCAAQAKIELGEGDLSSHIGCAYDSWARDYAHHWVNREGYSKESVQDQILAVRGELHVLGFDW